MAWRGLETHKRRDVPKRGFKAYPRRSPGDNRSRRHVGFEVRLTPNCAAQNAAASTANLSDESSAEANASAVICATRGG